LEADGAARRVEGDVAAADDDDLLADLRCAAEVELAQHLDGSGDALEVATGQADLGALLETGGKVDGPVALLEQAVYREIGSGPLTELEGDAQGEHLVDLALDHVVGQAVVGDAGAQHAAGDRLGLEHGDLVA
jgi:hypothetical protein